jgi:hypothetical protein
MLIQSIRPVDNVSNHFIVVADGISMTVDTCGKGSPIDALEALFNVRCEFDNNKGLTHGN